MCPGAVSTCSSAVIKSRQAACDSQCPWYNLGKSRGIQYCFTSDPNGGIPASLDGGVPDGGVGAPFCAPCDCTDGALTLDVINKSSGPNGVACGDVTSDGICFDDRSVVYCQDGGKRGLTCDNMSSCQVDVCGSGARCCPK
jgi:hypothetical protein